MLALPGEPLLDKSRLIGGCVRLRVAVDGARLASEVAALPEALWQGTGGRGSVHLVTQAIFLRGFAPSEGEWPIEDREPLAALPYVRELITRTLGRRAQRCLLARLPGGAQVAPHMDQADYFSQTLRVHVPVVTHEGVQMICDGSAYAMRTGEAWAINNSAIHAVWNRDPGRSRTHLICDFLPDDTLLTHLAFGERGLGTPIG